LSARVEREESSLLRRMLRLRLIFSPFVRPVPICGNSDNSRRQAETAGEFVTIALEIRTRMVAATRHSVRPRRLLATDSAWDDRCHRGSRRMPRTEFGRAAWRPCDAKVPDVEIRERTPGFLGRDVTMSVLRRLSSNTRLQCHSAASTVTGTPTARSSHAISIQYNVRASLTSVARFEVRIVPNRKNFTRPFYSRASVYDRNIKDLKILLTIILDCDVRNEKIHNKNFCKCIKMEVFQ